jgi:hypothetical protein
MMPQEHPEPDMDQAGGPSDFDFDNVPPPNGLPPGLAVPI